MTEQDAIKILTDQEILSEGHIEEFEKVAAKGPFDPIKAMQSAMKADKAFKSRVMKLFAEQKSNIGSIKRAASKGGSAAARNQSGLAKGLGYGAVALGTASGLAYGGGELIEKATRSHRIKESYEQMPKVVPLLKEHPKSTVKQYFDVVKTFSPTAASNPLVAGALVSKMIEFNGVDHKLVQDIANIESRTPSGMMYDIGKATASSLAKIPAGI